MLNGGEKKEKSTAKVIICLESPVLSHTELHTSQPTLLTAAMSLCKVCEEALVLPIDPEDDVDDEAGASSAAGPSTASVPDDLELPCGCHCHWYVENRDACSSYNTFLMSQNIG